MKLRTELLHTWHLGKPKDYVHYKVVTDVEHDTLAAHALLQAMEKLQPNILCDAIQQRADELIREWTNQSEV